MRKGRSSILLNSDVLDGTSGLDRRKSGGVVFNDPAKLNRRESILHPLVLEHRRELLVRSKRAGNQVIAYESAHLLETKRRIELR